ncbi:MAG: bifunctional ornithine acetyltransferase/N-acetylglutamate synthase [Candidatus Methanoliparum thermophilum]|uniref:Arginine biosynthesis bifunctional protein ArgJ n=1 Tax=Methanoliparum thermophilum TaxID=2491083 RepID=A0A520KQI8_METT2|nr:bifunctional ornithine acetyltransferase/N-acetylglutamate synthase [Candidatus Methanoliparum sp. LAM-1]RZN63835.1 MAG: bifunctional ornithine acetyltransferase/N-acetylglutamate synthase [Candidatus Methanoliparum thermophilum]BDC36441.1 ornithine acetyltransferase [Candidatus Methanoliparum sp. LAM-1]
MGLITLKGGICAVEGVKANGIKEKKKGLSIILAEGCSAGVFTTNKIKAAPVVLTEKNLALKGRLRGVIANSGSANAFTGEEGYKDAIKMAKLLADRIDSPIDEIGLLSTGVIGERIDLCWIEKNFDKVFSGLDSSEESSKFANRGIMTTDTKEKDFAVEYNDMRVGGIAKGSGMIAPNMATMLSLIYTDADFSSKVLKRCLFKAVDKSFNMLSIDGDMSTNDTVIITSTNALSAKEDEFQDALDIVCIELAKKIAEDGEGATKYIEAHVKGAIDKTDAKRAAKSIIESNLVKTAIFGGDPNWGRIVAAVGYSGAKVDENKISLLMHAGGIDEDIIIDGSVQRFNEDNLKYIMSKDRIFIEVDLGKGREEATAFGCDLSYDYVKINGAYRT